MNIHKNARLTPHGRALIVCRVASGQTPEATARAAGVCPQTVRKWVGALRGRRRRRPARSLIAPASPVSADAGRHRRENRGLRRQRWTARQIAAETGVSPATVSRILRRLGLRRIQALEPAEPVRRYQRIPAS
jgi:transposase-like protein